MHGVRNPNGIKWHDDRLYVTDWGQVKTFDLLEADSKAKVLYSRLTVFDDLLVHCEHLLVTDFFAGTVIAMNFSGQHIYETPPTWMPGASSVLVARAPLFSRPGLLVTERGILLEPDSEIGNQLSFFSSEAFQEKIPDC